MSYTTDENGFTRKIADFALIANLAEYAAKHGMRYTDVWACCDWKRVAQDVKS